MYTELIIWDIQRHEFWESLGKQHLISSFRFCCVNSGYLTINFKHKIPEPHKRYKLPNCQVFKLTIFDLGLMILMRKTVFIHTIQAIKQWQWMLVNTPPCTNFWVFILYYKKTWKCFTNLDKWLGRCTHGFIVFAISPFHPLVISLHRESNSARCKSYSSLQALHHSQRNTTCAFRGSC